MESGDKVVEGDGRCGGGWKAGLINIVLAIRGVNDEENSHYSQETSASLRMSIMVNGLRWEKACKENNKADERSLCGTGGRVLKRV